MKSPVNGGVAFPLMRAAWVDPLPGRRVVEGLRVVRLLGDLFHLYGFLVVVWP